MKLQKIKITGLLIIFLLAGVGVVQAQKTRDEGSNPKKDAALFINRTNKMMIVTASTVKEKQVYTGYLVKAKKKQQMAVKAYKEGNFAVAVKKSYIARRYSFLAYKANGQAVPEKWRINQKEKRIYKTMIKVEISDEELQKKVTDDELSKENKVIINQEELPSVGSVDGNGKSNG